MPWTRTYAWLALLCCLFVFIWFLLAQTEDDAAPKDVELLKSEKSSSTDSLKKQESANSKGDQKNPSSDIVLLQDELQGYGSAEAEAIDDIRLLQNLIEVFQYHLKYNDALPTAGNKELTAALLGENRYNDRFISKDFSFLNAEREITDRWGSPLIFHFESAHCPDIRSVGPDKTPWTEDDVVFPYSSQ